jgi:carboxymethylenebutenolidase
MQQPELDSLVPARDYNRRDFVRTALGSGFAAAVLPVTRRRSAPTAAA